MVLDSAVGDVVYPGRGIIAGCTHATAVLKLALARSLQGLLERPLWLKWDVYIDDLAVMVSGRQLLVTQVVSGARALAFALQRLGLEFPYGKGALMSSDPALLQTLRDDPGDLDGPVFAGSARNLGIDF